MTIRPSTGTVFILFTDIASSTELLEKIGDEAMDQVRREHFQLLRESVRASAGEVVKTVGDGMMVAFASGIDAIGCAVAMHEAVNHYNQQPGVHEVQMRVGLHAGEAVREGGDYFGTPVVIAKRLCDLATPGQILASDLVRALVGSRGSFRFLDTGPVSLKGIAMPLPAKEIAWSSMPASAPAAAGATDGVQVAVVPVAGMPPLPPSPPSAVAGRPYRGDANRGVPLFLVLGGAAVAGLIAIGAVFAASKGGNSNSPVGAVGLVPTEVDVTAAAVPSTSVPPTQVPPTEVPPTEVPPTPESPPRPPPPQPPPPAPAPAPVTVPTARPSGSGAGQTSASASAMCDAGNLKVDVTANATGSLALTRVRVTVDGRSVIDTAVNGQTYSRSVTFPASPGSHSVVASAEDSSGQMPSTSVSSVCNPA
jgi:class 3 adenylate cyclase